MPPGAPIIKRILVYVEEHAKELKKAYPSIAWTADKVGGYFVVTGTVESLKQAGRAWLERNQKRHDVEHHD